MFLVSMVIIKQDRQKQNKTKHFYEMSRGKQDQKFFWDKYRTEPLGD